MWGSSNLGKSGRHRLRDAFRQTQDGSAGFSEPEKEIDLASSSNYPFDYSEKSLRFAFREGARLAALDPEGSTMSSGGSALVDIIARRMSRGKTAEEKRKERLETLLRLALIEQIRKRLEEIEQELGKQRERLQDLDDLISRIAKGKISFEKGLSAGDRVALERAGVDVSEMEDVAGALKHLKKHDWNYGSLNADQKDKLKTYGIYEQNIGQIAYRSGGDIDRIMAGVVDRTYAEEVRQNIKRLEAEQKELTQRLEDIEHNRNNSWASDPVMQNILGEMLPTDTSIFSVEQSQKIQDAIRLKLKENDKNINSYTAFQDENVIVRRPPEEYVKPPEDIEVREFYKKLDEIKDLPAQEKLQKEYDLVLDLSKDANAVLKTDESVKELLNLQRYKILFEQPQQITDVEPLTIQPDGKINLAVLGINN